VRVLPSGEHPQMRVAYAEGPGEQAGVLAQVFDEGLTGLLEAQVWVQLRGRLGDGSKQHRGAGGQQRRIKAAGMDEEGEEASPDSETEGAREAHAVVDQGLRDL